MACMTGRGYTFRIREAGRSHLRTHALGGASHVAPRWLYAGRAAGRDRDHWRADRPVVARRAGGPRVGPQGPVPQQPEANGVGAAQLRATEPQLLAGVGPGAPRLPNLVRVEGSRAAVPRAAGAVQSDRLQERSLQ